MLLCDDVWTGLERRNATCWEIDVQQDGRTDGLRTQALAHFCRFHVRCWSRPGGDITFMPTAISSCRRHGKPREGTYCIFYAIISTFSVTMILLVALAFREYLSQFIFFTL